MKIAVIGAGSVGSTLGNAWRQRGHNVSYGVRNPDDDKYAALGEDVTSNVRAVHGADVVVLCTPWPATRQAVQDCGNLVDKVVIDCTNPLTPDFTALEVGHMSSGARKSPGGRWVREFARQ